MEDKIRNIIAFINFLILGYLFIKKVIKGESWKSKLIEEGSKNNCYTEAIAIDNDSSYLYRRTKNSIVFVKYEYEVNGKKYYKKLGFKYYGSLLDYPYKITVYYKKNNPRKAACENELLETKANGCAMIFVLMMIMGIVNGIIFEIIAGWI